jgi:hypothetical protein
MPGSIQPGEKYHVRNIMPAGPRSIHCYVFTDDGKEEVLFLLLEVEDELGAFAEFQRMAEKAGAHVVGAG